jgi:hypothetical protein
MGCLNSIVDIFSGVVGSCCPYFAISGVCRGLDGEGSVVMNDKLAIDVKGLSGLRAYPLAIDITLVMKKFWVRELCVISMRFARRCSSISSR